MGYVPRQAIYACATCSRPDMEPAGICLACSYECHEGHELLELYTKRNFRCDCGNSKFPGDLKCKLLPSKQATNPDNSYSQNFRGVYCTCKRPYPDPEDSVEDEMLQCIVCEDWLHGRHLGFPVPDDSDFEEMICEGCMKKCDFLWSYIPGPSETKLVKEEGEESVDVEAKDESSQKAQPESEETKVDPTPEPSSESTPTDVAGASAAEPTSESPVVGAKPATNDKSSDNKPSSACLLEDLKARDVKSRAGATFWTKGWRAKLCSCTRCKALYEEKRVKFLMDEEDTIHAYEARGRAKTTSATRYDQGMQALSGMDRTQQVEMLSGYNDLKSELNDYLKKFAENGKVVREEDIREFFGKMASKRQKTSHGIQYHCK